MKWWIVFPVVAVFGYSAYGKTITVNNKTGPVKTIAEAVAQCEAGDTIVVQNTGEPYRESFSFNNKRGTKEKPIVFEGNGATISGAFVFPPEQWKQASADVVKLEGLKYPANILVVNGKPSTMGRTSQNVSRGGGEPYKPIDSLGPEEWTWQTNALYFKLGPGRTLKDYVIEVGQQMYGFQISGNESEWIIVRNVRASYFLDDGFNIHGNGKHLVFERIEASYNVDDGVSFHEQAQGEVVDSLLIHNGRGIADVGFAETAYERVVIGDNVGPGALFHGGVHRLEDCIIFNNGSDVAICSFPKDNNIAGITFRNSLLYNTIGKGVVGIFGNITLDHCTLVNVPLSQARSDAGGTLKIMHCVFTGSPPQTLLSLKENWTCESDYNCWHLGTMVYQGKSYMQKDWATYQTVSGQDHHSLAVDPLLDEVYQVKPDSPCNKAGKNTNTIGAISVISKELMAQCQSR